MQQSASILSLFRAPQLLRDVPADAGFLNDEAAVLGKATKEMPYVFF